MYIGFYLYNRDAKQSRRVRIKASRRYNSHWFYAKKHIHTNNRLISMHVFRCICTANDCIGDLQALFTKYNLFKVKDLYWKQVVSAKEEGGKVNV